MSVVFTKTAQSSARGSFISALIVAFIGGLCISVAFLFGDLPTIVKAILAIVGGLCLLWVKSLVRDGMRYLQSGRDWRVEITDRKLSWHSPVQDIMPTIEVPLSNIQTLRHVRTKVGKKGARYSDAYTIELHKGETIKISNQISGIDPGKVFDAMHEKGVPLAKEIIRTKEQFRQKRAQKRAQKKEARANKQLQRASVVSSH